MLHKKSKTIALLLTGAMLGAAPLGAQAQAVTNSWFEIELLAFSRQAVAPLREQFDTKVRHITTAGALDLLSPHYQPPIRSLLQALPHCKADYVPSLAWSQPLTVQLKQAWKTAELPITTRFDYPSVAEQLAFTSLPYQSFLHLVDQFQRTSFPVFCQYEQLNPQVNNGNKHPLKHSWDQGDFSLTVRYEDGVAGTQLLPVTPPGSEEHQASAYLAPASALQLNDLAYQLRHRAGHQVLLHSVWRQQLTNKRQSRSSRWYAGQNFSNRFDYFGQLKASTVQNLEPTAALEQNIAQLQQELQQVRKPELTLSAAPVSAVVPHQVWQLDGLVNVYSDRMLFVETAFNLRRLSPDGQGLQTFFSQDQTRLLLDDIHYLDHPYLGLVIQIRRFTPPLLAGAATEASSIVNAR